MSRSQNVGLGVGLKGLVSVSTLVSGISVSASLLFGVVGHRCCVVVSELVKARRRLRDRQLPAAMCGDSSVEGSEHNLTLVMIVIIVVFVVCQTPAFVNQLLFLLIGADDYLCGKVSTRLTQTKVK